MSPLRSRPLFTVQFETDPHVIGDVPQGYFRRTGIIRSGRFFGDRLNGRVMPGGGDFLFSRPDGVIHIDVRAVLETDAGDSIYMTYTGRLKGPDDMEERLRAGETLTADDVYFRTLVQFETAGEPIRWLNDIVAVGRGSRGPDGPSYAIHEIL